MNERKQSSRHAPVLRFPRLSERRMFRRTLREIPRLDLAEIKSSRYLVDGFVVEGCTQVSYGRFGTRKTSVHLLAGWSVSQGIPFLGKSTLRRMVLYLDYENPAIVQKAYCSDLGIDPSSPWFTIWDRTKQDPPQPGEVAIQDFIRRCKRTTGSSPWIIFDSWTSLLRAGDSGNEVSHAAPIFQAIRRYCDQGATCTIIDHTGKKKSKDPIGTSAKMTQMDTAHYFTAHDELSMDGRSARSIIRVENFLKRFAPKDVGTFSIEIKASMDERDEWHTRSMLPTKDIAALKAEGAIELMKGLIRKHPTSGKDDLAEFSKNEKDSDGKQIISRNRATELLESGIGTHWRVIPSGSKKQLFRVL